MFLILADDISGGLCAAAFLLGALVASVVALCGLVPAWQRKRRLTFALIAPAVVVTLLVTIWIGYGYITDGLKDPDLDMSDFVLYWILLAGPPLATSLLSIVVFVLRGRREYRRSDR